MITNYELLKDVANRDDILYAINYHRKWSVVTPEGIAEKVEYHYGDGMRGLINALYNLVLSLKE